MRFGVSFLPDSSPRTKSPVDYYREVFDLAGWRTSPGWTTSR